VNEDQGARLAGCLIVGAALLLVPLNWFLFSAFAPHLWLHDVTRALYGYRALYPNTEVSLVPEVFSVGQTKDEVHSALNGSAVEPWPIPDLPEVRGVIEGYSLDAGHDIGCRHRLLIVIQYSEDQVLQSANVRRQSGNCI
jgi:hypothetical protein